jgi:hypothetical protein
MFQGHFRGPSRVGRLERSFAGLAFARADPHMSVVAWQNSRLPAYAVGHLGRVFPQSLGDTAEELEDEAENLPPVVERSPLVQMQS